MYDTIIELHIFFCKIERLFFGRPILHKNARFLFATFKHVSRNGTSLLISQLWNCWISL